MDTARDRRTGKLVEALLLKDIVDVVDQNGYECPGCSATAIPCSFKPEKLRTPYFRVDESHAEDCDVGGKTVPVKSARQKTASTNKQTTPGRYPNRMILNNTRTIVSDIKNAAMKTRGAKTI